MTCRLFFYKIRTMSRPIYDALMEYSKTDVYPFHMPGHKRAVMNGLGNVYHLDITEIPGFDDLHMPEGIIRESMDMVRDFYGTKESYYLVNGSTCGLLATISAVCRTGDQIILSRNCHRSVHNAVALLGLDPIYWEKGKPLPLTERVRAVVVVSPDYEGFVANIASLAAQVWETEAVLIVDEAHGAHFPFHEAFPTSAIALGADIVVQSLHKTLPALTQTGLLHVCSDRIDRSRLEYYLSVYQSSSPSYVLMASAEYAIDYAIYYKVAWERYVALLREYREKLAGLGHIRLADFKGQGYDIGKIVLLVAGYNRTGLSLAETLRRQFRIEVEMAELDYVVLMTSLMDTRKGMERLYQALLTIDQDMVRTGTGVRKPHVPWGEKVMTPRQALEAPSMLLPYEAADRYVSGDYLYLYPPGVPLVVPGEKIDQEIIRCIRQYIEHGFTVRGCRNGRVRVIKS